MPDVMSRTTPNMKPSMNSDQWIHELARNEVTLDAQALLKGDSPSSPSQAIEEGTVDFLSDFRSLVQEYTRIFNSFSDGGKKFQEIKVFGMAQNPLEFMIFRNGVKLLVTHPAVGMIHIAYQRHNAQGVVSSAPEIGFPETIEIVAHLSTFGVVQWTSRGERVEVETLARFFFGQFVRATREQKKLKSNQQALLQHIKTLLQDQGIEL